ncbi:MAG: hypothetical protein LH479_02625 [Polaromonas sp.]|nr:hypothetical protein [Polaromonas sp.]
MRCQLVHVLLRDELRRHGMPPHWVSCQIQLVVSRRRGPGMLLRLVVRHWDDRLIRHLLAFEKSFQAELERFEPLAKEWLHGISWQIEPLNTCPYLVMPEKAYWQKAPVAPVMRPREASFSAAVAAGAVTVPVAAIAPGTESSDIQQIFAIRDR